MKQLLSILTILSLLFLSAPQAYASGIALDNGNNGAEATGTTSWTHTMSSAANGVLIVVAQDLSGDQCTTATFNGVSMTQYTKRLDGAGKEIYMYYLLAPASGAHTVTVNCGGGTVDTASVSYTGVSNSAFPDNGVPSATSGTASTFSMSLAPLTANSWLVMYAENNHDVTNPSTNTTSRALDGGGIGRGLMGDSNGPEPASSFTMTMAAASGSGSWAGIMISMAPAAATTVVPTSIVGLIRSLWW